MSFIKASNEEGLRSRNPHLILDVNLAVIRRNAELLAETVKVPLLPVVKADAYGLGITAISEAIADLADGFCVFQAREAIAVDLAHRTGKRVLALGPPESLDPDDYLAHRITPAVCNPIQAQELRKASPALAVDTGMQRFSCAPEEVPTAILAGACREVFTHATRLDQVEKLLDCSSAFPVMRHAAASNLLDDPKAWLDAIRPGLALSQGAATVSSRIVEIHETRGPAGYSGFIAPRHGLILAGYSDGLRKGPCIINDRRSRILEVGMQSTYVEVEAGDKVGDCVILLDSGLPEVELSRSWGCSPHEVLCSLAFAATRSYRS